MRRVVCVGLVLGLSIGCGGGSPSPARTGGPSGETPTAARSDLEGARPEAASSARAEGVRFQQRALATGTVMVVERSQESRIELSERRSRKLVSIVQGTLGRVKTRTTILATQGAAVTKKKVEYLEGQSEQRVGDRVQRVPNPLIGKTYVLESRGGKLLISRPGGAAVSDYERERLELEHANLGRPSAFASLLPEGAVRPGERLTPDPATLAEAFGKHDVQVEQASIVLEAVTDEGGEAVGKFRISMKLVESDERTVRETELGGTVLIQTETGWPVLVDLSGPVRLEGSPPNANELSGKGQVSLRVQTHYE